MLGKVFSVAVLVAVGVIAFYAYFIYAPDSCDSHDYDYCSQVP